MGEVAEGKNLSYYLGRDNKEDVRLDLQSRGIWEMLGNRFHLTPVLKPRKILDIGCGTGIVTSFLGEMYPDAEVVGIDLYPDPGLHLGPNVSYVQGNIEDLVKDHPKIQEGSFDFIFSRLLVFGFKNWPERVKDIAKLLKPGGYYECQDDAPLYFLNGTVKEEQPGWIQKTQEAAPDFGLDLRISANIAGYMKQADLEVFRQIIYKWPIGHWLSKDLPETTTLGNLSMKEAHVPIKQFCEKLLTGLYSEQEMEQIKADVDQTMVDSPGVHFSYTVTIGRKPL